MPKIFRAMKKAVDGKAVTDATGKGLGVRGVPVNGISGVDLETSGKVVMNGKGMSISPGWRDLPYFLISKRLKGVVAHARGASDLYCFSCGDGSFTDGALAVGLDLKVDRATHGNVVPQLLVTLDHFQADLANTQNAWVIDGT